MKTTDSRNRLLNGRFSKVWLFLQAFFTALALNTELGVADDEIDGISNAFLAKLYAILAQIESGIQDKRFFLTVLMASLFAGYLWISMEKNIPFLQKKHNGLAVFLP